MSNGVDLARFFPLSTSQCRAELGVPVDGPILIFVGHLVERKGHHLAIEALDLLPTANLLIVGDGPERHTLERRAEKGGRRGRVVFIWVTREVVASPVAGELVDERSSAPIARGVSALGKRLGPGGRW